MSAKSLQRLKMVAVSMVVVMVAFCACDSLPFDQNSSSADSIAAVVNPGVNRQDNRNIWVPPVSRPLGKSISDGVVIDILTKSRDDFGVLKSISGLAVGSDGALMVASRSEGKIIKISTLGEITHLAGMGGRLEDGDGPDALQSSLLDPSWIVVDGSGAIYVSTLGKIRRIDVSGEISTVAGGASNGFAGDGKSSEHALFRGNSGMAIDGDGNLFVADRGNARVRRVGHDGIVTTIAGDGRFSSDGDNIQATEASLNSPVDVAIGPGGEIYISEFDGHKVRKIDVNGVISTFAGTGVAGWSGDGESAINSKLNSPRSIEVDRAGRLYISDWGNRAIRVVDLDGTIQLVAGHGVNATTQEGIGALRAKLDPVVDFALSDDGSMYFAQQLTGQIHVLRDGSDAERYARCEGKLTPIPTASSLTKKIVVEVAGKTEAGFYGDNGPVQKAGFVSPESLAIGSDGVLYVADTGNHRIRAIDKEGVIRTIAGTGEPGFSGDGSAALSSQLAAPTALAVGASDNIIFYDSANLRVRRIDECGNIHTIAGTGHPGDTGDKGPAIKAKFRDISAIVLDPSGGLYVADPASNKVRYIDSNGIIDSVAGTGVSESGPDGGQAVATSLDGPSGLALGKEGVLYIAETRAGTIRFVSPDGNIGTLVRTVSEIEDVADDATLVLNGLSDPFSLAVDEDDNIYIAELTGSRVTSIDADGLTRLVAGSDYGDLSTDDLFVEVKLLAPRSLALDLSGSVFVLDSGGGIWSIGNGNITPSNKK